MAAAALLAGMESESAGSLLRDVRYYTSPPGNTFFAPLDTILENYDPRTEDSGMSTLQRGDVIEVQGPACSGKTQLLQFFAMTTCLPSSWEVELTVRGSSRPPRKEKIAIGGRGKCAIIVDCDGRFGIERAYHLVRSHLKRRIQEHAATIPALYSAETSPEALHEETIRSLARLHIFTPTSSLSLTATFLQLPHYKAFSTELTFLLIDNISAFNWLDRYQAEQDRASGKKSKIPGSGSPMKHILGALNEVRQHMGVVTVITNMAFPNFGDVYPSESSPFFRQHLPKPYPSPFETRPDVEVTEANPLYPPQFDPSRPLARSSLALFRLTHHITLHAPPSKPVSSPITVENAVKEEPFRSMEQKEIGSMAFVRMPGVERGDGLGRWELVVRENVIDGL